MGKQQARLLRFALKYPGWHSAGADCRATVRGLAGIGLLETSGEGRTLQFRLARSDNGNV